MSEDRTFTIEIGDEERDVVVRFDREISTDRHAYGNCTIPEMHVVTEVECFFLDGARVTQGHLTSIIGEEEMRRILKDINDD